LLQLGVVWREYRDRQVWTLCGEFRPARWSLVRIWW
jgi:hypothetical protein